MAEDNVNIQMRLISVSEVSFMMSPGKIGDDVNPDAVQIGFSTQIQPDVENDTFNLFFGTRYELDGDVVLECLYKFEFEVKISASSSFITRTKALRSTTSCLTS